MTGGGYNEIADHTWCMIEKRREVRERHSPVRQDVIQGQLIEKWREQPPDGSTLWMQGTVVFQSTP